MEKGQRHSQLHDKERTMSEEGGEDALCPVAIVFKNSRKVAVCSSAVRVG